MTSLLARFGLAPLAHARADRPAAASGAGSRSCARPGGAAPGAAGR
ncbi:MAG: hypothetical protein R3F43_04035 [bacterium]